MFALTPFLSKMATADLRFAILAGERLSIFSRKRQRGSISIRLKNFQNGSCISMIVRHVSCITRTKKVLTVFNILMLTVC